MESNCQTCRLAKFSTTTGVKQDYAEAERWFRRAAIEGNAGAQFNMGLMYANGAGINQDYEEAVKWFRKSAEQGYADAQSALAWMYANGTGIAQDWVYSYMWFDIAASAGSENAAKNRGVVAGLITSEQIAEAERLAKECVDKEYKDC